ncbi:MAG: thiamine phosphate synthase [Acidobacteriota bacterium]
MILCLVTDRRRLGAAMSAAVGDWPEVLAQQVAAAAAAGIDFVQVREPDLEARQLTGLVRDLVRRVEGSRTRILVNDRIDVAIAAGAAGVHLKEASILPDEARRIAPPGFVISCSVHTTAAVSSRKSADLLIAGTVRSTASKNAVDYLDKVGLEAIVKAAAGQSVLGIGGLNLSSVPLVVESSAAGMAAIGAFIPSADEDLSEFVQKRVSGLRLAFDSGRSRT